MGKGDSEKASKKERERKNARRKERGKKIPRRNPVTRETKL